MCSCVSRTKFSTVHCISSCNKCFWWVVNNPINGQWIKCKPCRVSSQSTIKLNSIFYRSDLYLCCQCIMKHQSLSVWISFIDLPSSAPFQVSNKLSHLMHHTINFKFVSQFTQVVPSLVGIQCNMYLFDGCCAHAFFFFCHWCWVDCNLNIAA